MKRNRVEVYFFLLGLLLFLLATDSCTEAEVLGGDHSVQLHPGDVETVFNLEIADSESPITRSITFTAQGSMEADTLIAGVTASIDTLQTRSATALADAQEKKVAGLWIGQYDAAGTTLLSSQYIESVTGMQTDGSVKVTAKLVAASNCHVRFVANAGNLGAVPSEAYLNKTILPYASTTDGRPQSNLLAMTGSWAGTIGKGTTELSPSAVKLTRLVAKITFTYKINGTDFSFTPTSVMLKNAPDRSQVAAMTDQPGPGAVVYGDYTGTISTSGATIYWYLPENMAGTGTNTANTEKEKTGQGVANATCIELTGNAVQNGVEYENVTFRFFPGSGANDYNLKRNDHFIMRIDLRGLDVSDKRITVGQIPSITVSPAGNLPVQAGGTKEVQITSRAGIVWSLPLPSWLSATVDGQTTPPGATLTNQGPCKVTFTTTEINPNADQREQEFTVNLDKEKPGSFTLTQEPSSFSVTAPTALIPWDGSGSVSGSIAATAGLAWTISPSTDNGITVSPASGSGNATLTFTAGATEVARTGTFTVSVTGADPARTAQAVVGQKANPIVTIDDKTLKGYYARWKAINPNWTWATWPPFDVEGDDVAASHGLTDVVLSDTPSMTGSYQLQVESTQRSGTANYATAKSYCNNLSVDGYSDWRLPTEIELYAMWDKARGTNNNAGDDEPDSRIFGEPFVASYYWSSSVYGGGSIYRSLLYFTNGTFEVGHSTTTTSNYYVRCVRDKN